MMRNEHFDKLMEQWADEKITDLDLMTLLIEALEELNSHMRENQP